MIPKTFVLNPISLRIKENRSINPIRSKSKTRSKHWWGFYGKTRSKKIKLDINRQWRGQRLLTFSRSKSIDQNQLQFTCVTCNLHFHHAWSIFKRSFLQWKTEKKFHDHFHLIWSCVMSSKKKKVTWSLWAATPQISTIGLEPPGCRKSDLIKGVTVLISLSGIEVRKKWQKETHWVCSKGWQVKSFCSKVTAWRYSKRDENEDHLIWIWIGLDLNWLISFILSEVGFNTNAFGITYFT